MKKSKHEEVLLDLFTSTTRKMLAVGAASASFSLIGRKYMAVVASHRVKVFTEIKVALIETQPALLLGHLVISEVWKPAKEKTCPSPNRAKK